MQRWIRVLIIGASLGSAPAIAEVDVVTGNGYEPFTDEELPNGGLATELVVEAFGEVGQDARIDFRPWARGYHDTLWEMFVGTFPYVHTDSRAEDMHYSEEPLAVLAEIVVSRSDDPIRFENAEALAGRSVCRPVGYAYPDAVEDLIETGDLDLTAPAEMSSCPRMVELGRVDFFVANNFTWPGLVISEELDEAAFHVDHDNPIRETALYFIAPRTDEGLATIEEFDRGLRALRASGRYDEIVERHVEVAVE